MKWPGAALTAPALDDTAGGADVLDATCSVEDCPGRAYCKGVCKRHYSRLQRHGTPTGGTPETIAGRLAEKVDRSGGPDACWPFTGQAIQRSGHRQMSWKGRMYLVHRLAYEVENGPIPVGLCVCHSCDNPPCCNPAHFFLGTQADNSHDRDRKGRQVARAGELHGNAKLAETDVRAIRAAYVPRVVSSYRLAEQYGVTQGAIWNVLSREGWRHV